MDAALAQFIKDSGLVLREIEHFTRGEGCQCRVVVRKDNRNRTVWGYGETRDQALADALAKA